MVREIVLRARRRFLLLAGLALASCLSPTLPLPPPDRPEISAPDSSGLVHVQGVAAPRVEVVAWNHQTDLIAGQVTGDDSHYDFTMAASVGDQIELWYIDGDEESQSVSVSVPAAAK